MRTIARFMDARNTAEGKFLSVLLSVLLVFSFLNVTMFTDYAGADTNEASEENSLPVEEPEFTEPEGTAEEPEAEKASEEVTTPAPVEEKQETSVEEEPAATDVEVELQLVDATIAYDGADYGDGDKLVAPLGEDLRFSVKVAEGAEVKVAATIGDEDVVLSPEADGSYILKGDQVTDALAVIGAVAELKKEDPIPGDAPEVDTPTQPDAQEPAAEEQPSTFEAEPADEADEPSGIHRNPVVQIVFQVGAVTLAHSEFLTNGETVQLPFVADPDGQIFTGWTFEPAGFVDTFNRVVVPADQAWDADNVKVTATAQFAEACTVTFKGERDNVVIATDKVAKGGALTAEQIAAASAKYQVPAGKKLVGWKVDGETLTEQTVINNNVEASAVVSDGTWVTFNSQGGTSVPSAQVREDGTIDCSAAPTRAGFNFDGWFTAATGGDKVTAGTKFESSATIYAHWTAQQVNYTVIYWQENANWNNQYLDEASRDKVQYSYVKSETKTGTAGQVTSVTAGAPDNGFKAARVEDKEIAGDGSTIVNVYYDREVYSIEFYTMQRGCGKEEHSHSYDESKWVSGFLGGHWEYKGGCYSDSWSRYPNCGLEEHKHNQYCQNNQSYKIDASKTITAKYGANIARAWPKNQQGYSSWYHTQNRGTIRTFMETMPIDGKFDGDQGRYYSPTSAESGSIKRTFYVEVDAGDDGAFKQGDKYYREYRVVETPGNKNNYTVAKWIDIQGYTLNQSLSTKEGSSYGDSGINGNAKGYYDRISYKIVFISEGKTVNEIARPYTAEISGDDIDGYAPVRAGYTFGGWYLDEACTEPARDAATGADLLSGPMPARNLTVYAKWIAPQVQVKVHAEASDGEGTDFTVDAGSVLDEAQLNEKAGIAEKIVSDPNAFLGWFTKTPRGGWQPFDLSTPIEAETELYAR